MDCIDVPTVVSEGDGKLMCGFAGFLGDTGISEGEFPQVLTQMGDAIKHRGPDDSGIWLNKKSDIGLVHRRLSILDLSAAGHQPMISPCKRFVLVYNGEIYNHREIRTELERRGGHFDWAGHSDTETLLAALRHWGIEGALSRLNGMFAFALWDDSEKSLILARDRMGEKPLYYGYHEGVFLFGSELKALEAYPGWKGEIDRDALTLFLRHNYVPAPWSIYKGIHKLHPAHYLVVREGAEQLFKPVCYWNIHAIAENGISHNKCDSKELIDELDVTMNRAIKYRMESDVPLGAFLSGGFDSSAVVAMMQSQSSKPVKTFSIGFNEKAYNEADHAKLVAEHLGTEHTELYVTPEEAMAVIPKLPHIYDEPFSDSSQIPTFLVSQLARQHVTVSLSGDGGDELFCGYNRYVMGYNMWQNLQRVPPMGRRFISWLLLRAPGHSLEVMQRILPRRYRVSSLADRLPKLAEVLVHNDGKSFYQDLISHWKKPDQVVIDAKEPDNITMLFDKINNISDYKGQMMLLDMMTYLPDDILTKVDRASMAVSLEARVPMLDHELIEFSWKIPMESKLRAGQGKWLLRQVLYKYVPQKIMERPKMGFGVPIEQWLRGPLREWGEELLDEKRICDEGFFDPKLIRKKWNEHISGSARWHYLLWDVLMFQAWRESHN